MLCNTWIACKDCYRWHLKIVQCLSKSLKKQAISFPCYWASSEIAFLNSKVTEVYSLVFIVPYLSPEANLDIIKHTYKEFLKANHQVFKYIDGGSE